MKHHNEPIKDTSPNQLEVIPVPNWAIGIMLWIISLVIGTGGLILLYSEYKSAAYFVFFLSAFTSVVLAWGMLYRDDSPQRQGGNDE